MVELVAGELDLVHERIAGRFGRAEPRARVREYLCGPVAGLERTTRNGAGRRASRKRSSSQPSRAQAQAMIARAAAAGCRSPGSPPMRDRAGAALADVAHVTEHVGSTAVPGLDAKPVIDLDVVVPDDAAADAAIRALAAAGSRHQGDLGIKDREAFLPPADAVYHHLYVVVAGSQPHRDHIDLRDYLRTHPAQAARYGDLKRRLAVLLKTDRSAYSEGKAEMISEFLRQARC